MPVTREYANSTVLVVDADQSRLERTVTVLDQAGYSCARATSGADALAMLAEQPPDVLITGVRVRSVSGLDLALQRYLTDRQSIVIDTEFRPSLAAEAGRLDAHYLVHPVGSQRLLRTVAEQLRRQAGGRTASMATLRPPRGYTNRARGGARDPDGCELWRLSDRAYGRGAAPTHTCDSAARAFDADGARPPCMADRRRRRPRVRAHVSELGSRHGRRVATMGRSGRRVARTPAARSPSLPPQHEFPETTASW